jgi:SpoVK/Ycf46/Vps4 family AAA+-type ATPase
MLAIGEELARNSIYRGKAIDGALPPQFLDLSKVSPEDVVYTLPVMQQLEANVWSPIRHADVLEELGQPTKRAVLFEGPYGTGKTLAAYLTGQVAIEHGWTFVYCRPGEDDLTQVIKTARMYQPSVLFFEDIDSVAGGGDKESLTHLLDMFDGIQAKGTRMLAILTTNHKERIHKGMVRPGRLDAVIHVGEMDRPGIERLVRRVVGDALEDDVNFDQVHEAFKGMMPAFVREGIDRAVRYSVARHDGVLGPIGTADLVGSAVGLEAQRALMEGAPEDATRPEIDRAIKGIVDDAVKAEVVGLQVVRHDNEVAWAELRPAE